jgi:hypothetical protein
MNYGRIRSGTLPNAMLSGGTRMKLGRVLRQGKEGKSSHAIDLAEQPAAADALQPPLRCGFQARLSRNVRCCPVHAMEKESTGWRSRCRTDYHLEGRFPCVPNTLDRSAGGGSWVG